MAASRQPLIHVGFEFGGTQRLKLLSFGRHLQFRLNHFLSRTRQRVSTALTIIIRLAFSTRQRQQHPVPEVRQKDSQDVRRARCHLQVTEPRTAPH